VGIADRGINAADDPAKKTARDSHREAWQFLQRQSSTKRFDLAFCYRRQLPAACAKTKTILGRKTTCIL
jgi:hypothetical protein